MKRVFAAFVLVLLTAGIAFAGHIEVRYQDGNVENWTGAVAAVTVLKSDKSLRIDYKDGNTKILHPDVIITAVNVITNGEASGSIQVHYANGQEEGWNFRSIRNIDIIIDPQYVLDIFQVDGSLAAAINLWSAEEKCGEVTFVKVVFD